MNERLTIQDLTDLLASKHSMTKKDAEAFVKEFFLLIEETLENEKYVKIKGLGTFKLIEVDNRESVNVNTGERFQIKGHTKVSFTPDTSLRDTINKPFAHFETVVLNDNTVLEDTQEEDVDGEEDETVEEVPAQITEALEEVKPESNDVEETVVEENVDIQHETAQDDKTISAVDEPILVAEEPAKEVEIPIVEEQQQMPVVLEKPEEVTSTLENAVSTEKVEESFVAPVAEQPKQTEFVNNPINSKIEITAEQIIAQELQKANLKPEVPRNQQDVNIPVAANNETVATTKKEITLPKEKSAVPYLVTIIVLVLLLCGGAVVFIYYPDLFSSSPNKNALDMPVATQPVQPTVQLADTIEKKDTVVNKEMPVQSSPNVKKEDAAPIATAPVYSDSAVYTITGTKGTHTISAGESLTKVSLRYYGTKALWPYIVKHNQGVIKNPDNVPYGTTIKIPELTKK